MADTRGARRRGVRWCRLRRRMDSCCVHVPWTADITAPLAVRRRAWPWIAGRRCPLPSRRPRHGPRGGACFFTFAGDGRDSSCHLSTMETDGVSKHPAFIMAQDWTEINQQRCTFPAAGPRCRPLLHLLWRVIQFNGTAPLMRSNCIWGSSFFIKGSLSLPSSYDVEATSPVLTPPPGSDAPKKVHMDRWIPNSAIHPHVPIDLEDPVDHFS
jgi:hypothetical protein